MAVLTGSSNDDKYRGGRERHQCLLRDERAGKLPALFRVCGADHARAQRGRPLLYEDPYAASPSLSPRFDVVTTTVYKCQSTHGVELTGRELALKLGESKRYPDRKTLIEFARHAAGVPNLAT